MVGQRHLREQHPIGAVATPQDLTGTKHGDVLDSLMGDPGIRLAETTGRATRTYKGGFDIEVQRFFMPSGPNTDEDLASSVVSVTHSPVINKRRGHLPFGD
ncbi:hypothetical protein GKE82_05910 [Conexibacter sp. W3-3-2]|uniref:hypothetical protein n=1 Tax=Conexibacter sp. W3-3-2 TaxID=2675227 RepID=UPI0012B7A8A1|nr:hypothetical protein [Conexibacter sp. W3-3-2]MTD43851.1 hypothetical protein [Conexibacter sp. W3-3-2]